MRIKDPTAWMDDLTIFVDDEEIATTAAMLEPDLLYRGSKLAAAAWLSLVGTMAGAFAAVTLSSETRSSILTFAIYLIVAFVLMGGLRPATHRLLGRPIVWPAKLTFFWAVLLACIAVFSAGFASPWLAYGLACGGGFFIGMMHGSLNPQYIKREDTWMAASLGLGILSALLATLVQQILLSAPDTIGAAALVGAIAGGLFSAPMSVLLFRLWDEAHRIQENGDVVPAQRQLRGQSPHSPRQRACARTLRSGAVQPACNRLVHPARPYLRSAASELGLVLLVVEGYVYLVATVLVFATIVAYLVWGYWHDNRLWLCWRCLSGCPWSR